MNMNIGIDAPLGTVVLTTDEYRELVETRLVAIAAGEDMVAKIRRLKESLQQSKAEVVVVRAEMDDLKEQMDKEKKSSDFWYGEYVKLKDEMQALKDQLAALGGRGETHDT